jgi:predicted nucleotidyltransferase
MIATESDFRWIAERITALLDPDRIYLFGSYSLGTAHDQSDIDLLIVVPSGLPRWHRGKDVVAAMRAFPSEFDLLFYTPQELEEELQDPCSFAARVLGNGRLLYSKLGESEQEGVTGCAPCSAFVDAV